MTSGRTCKSCPRLATKGRYCSTCKAPKEYDTRRVRKADQYNASYRRRASKLRARAKRNWQTSVCVLCGRRLYDGARQVVGRQVQVHHEYRGSDEHLGVTHSECNEAAGEPQTLGEVLAELGVNTLDR